MISSSATARRIPRLLTILAAVAMLSAACSGSSGSADESGGANSAAGSDGGDGSAAAPAECDREPPYTIRAEGHNEPAGGAAEWEVTHALAQRVPIVPGESGELLEGEEKEAADEQARTTDLALIGFQLADFPLEREELEGFGFAQPEPPAGATLVSVGIVPPTEAGLAAGDVVTAGDPEYDSVTSFSTLSVVVQTSERSHSDNAFTDMTGEVEILALDDESVCARADVVLTNGDEPVATVEGVLVAEVVRVSERFYLT